MNKALIILILYVLNFTVAISSDGAKWSWENCQDKLKAYADKYETLADADKQLDDKVHACAETYYTSDQIEKCENAVPITSLSDPQKTFYNDCVKEYEDMQNKKYKPRDEECGSEKDANRVCSDDANCVTYKKSNFDATKKADYAAITGGVDSAKTKCSNVAANCPDSLKGDAKIGCLSYEIGVCLDKWKETNIPATDTAYLQEQCIASLTNGVIAKFSAILLIAFFTL